MIENEEDCTRWLEHLERVKIALAGLVNQVYPSTVRMMADKDITEG